MNLSEYNDYNFVLGRIATKKLQILHIEGGVPLEHILGRVELPDMERILRRIELPELLWLYWRECPYSSLPSWIPVKNLRHLEVSWSELKTLWESESESQVIRNLLCYPGMFSRY